MVIDRGYERGQRFADRAYVLAEIVSNTNDEPVPGTSEPWMAVKRRLYLAHRPCEAVVLIEPDCIDIALDLRATDGWKSSRLKRLEDRLIILSCGLDCLVADIYEGTRLLYRAEEP